MLPLRNRRFGLALALALGATLALPAPSPATTVSRIFVEGFSGPAVSISDSTGVTDGLSVSGSQTTTVRASSVSRTGSGLPITAGSGCTQTSATVVTCPGATFLLASLGDRSDSLTDVTNLTTSMDGGVGNDRVVGGSGADRSAAAPVMTPCVADQATTRSAGKMETTTWAAGPAIPVETPSREGRGSTRLMRRTA